MLSSHLYLRLPRGLFPSGFATKTYIHFSSPHSRHKPAYLILLDLTILFLAKSSLQPPTISFLLNANIPSPYSYKRPDEVDFFKFT
jgi:hypothetical protein